MCGIAGFFNRDHRSKGEELVATVSRMISQIAHRGPDSNGVWSDEAVGIAIGHCRLAILDLTPAGYQPMVSADGRYVITYNGEIYNYRSIHNELTAIGHVFKGTSDTEVILGAFVQWGIEASLKKFVGMFAFSLWDRKDRVLFLVRDRIGEKPLYYGWAGRSFLFGSELKSFRVHPSWYGEVDRDALTLYFRYNYLPAPYSIYKGIRKLTPGTILRLGIDDLMNGDLMATKPYWSLYEVAEAGAAEPFRGTKEEAVEQLDVLLSSAVSGQMVGDVPLGAFLSGGIDSSTIVALMQAQSNRPVKTFTVGFDDIAYNEAGYAKAVARHLGTDHTEHYVTSREALDVIPRLPELYDEPFADSSQIPTYLVSKVARRQVTVSLSGDGGDEVFCGYNRHVVLGSIWKKIERVPKPIRSGLAEMLAKIPASWSEIILRRNKTGILSDQVQKLSAILKLDDPEQMYLHLLCFWDDPTSLVLNSSEPSTILTTREMWPRLANYMERLLYLESITSLPDDMLVKLDRASMGVSLESRVPFLDHRVLEFSWKLPFSLKMRDGIGKWVLRQVLYRYVPKSLIERPKKGFSVPIDVWLKGPLRDWAEGYLNENRIKSEGYLNASLVSRRWDEHMNGKRKWQQHLWGVLMFQTWLESQKIPRRA